LISGKALSCNIFKVSKKRRYKVARAKHEFLKGDNDEPNSLFEY